MVVRNQQVAAAFDQSQHRVVHVQGNESALDRAAGLTQAGEPRGEKRERQRVRHGELDHVLRRRRVGPEHGARALHRLQHFQRLVVQGLSGWREARGVRRPIDQIRAGPGLQRLDATRERGLRHVAQLGRAAEAAGLSQTDKIFEPLGFHGARLWRDLGIVPRVPKLRAPTAQRQRKAAPWHRAVASPQHDPANGGPLPAACDPPA
ncbi:hypothetical protein FQZ97_910030 [compost metagenome]